MFREISHCLGVGLIRIMLLVILTACGTLEVGVEPGASEVASSVTTPAEVIGKEDDGAATSVPVDTPPSLAETVQIEPQDDSGKLTIIGRAMTLDFPTGWVQLLIEGESPLANEDGILNVRISEWARIADPEGVTVDRDELTRGVKLEILATRQGDDLVADKVVVLEPGNPRPEDNPGNTQVDGLVTPLSEGPTREGVIGLFTINGADQPVDPGAPLTLSWSVQAESVVICSYQVPRPLNQTCYQDLPPSGALEVQVPESARQAIDYTLLVQTEGRVESESVRVPLTADLECQYEWYFEPEFLLECPVAEAMMIRPQAQLFERGMMIRLEDSWYGSDPILVVLIDDDEVNEYALTEGPLSDPWQPGMPETDKALTPPEPLFQPSRGFGMLWRGELPIPSLDDDRFLDGESLLGWAVEPVFEFDAMYQCDEENPLFGVFNCHLSLPDGQIVTLPGETND